MKFNKLEKFYDERLIKNGINLRLENTKLRESKWLRNSGYI